MTLAMNPEVRAQWTAALRSGDYAQGGGFLHTTTYGYCCLGVLCDLAVKAGVIPAPVHHAPEADFWSFDGESHFLPEAVMRWAGLDSPDPAPPDEETLSRINDNDDRGAFAGIADLIDGGAS